MLLSLGLLGGAASLPAGASAAGSPIQDLGVANTGAGTGGVFTWGAINAADQVGGFEVLPGNQYVTVRWDAGQVITLGNQRSLPSGGAAIASNGTVLGGSGEQMGSNAFLYPAWWPSTGGENVLHAYPGGEGGGFRWASPNGTAILQDPPDGGMALSSPPYTSATPIPGSSSLSSSASVNDAGHAVVLMSSSPGGPAFWDGAALHPMSVQWGGTGALNGRDQVVGRTTPSTGAQVAVIVQEPAGVPQPLPELPLASAGDFRPTALNDSDVVVGDTSTGAAIWNPGGTTRLLDTYLPANSGWHLTSAVDVNAQGDVLGLGTLNGQSHYFLLQTSQTDLQAEGLEITQGIQQPVWASPAQVPVPGLGSVAGGTYTGVTLVRDVPTVVRLYASSVPRAGAQAQAGVTAVLHAYSGGHELAGSPITAATRTLDVGPALPAARLDPAGAYSFALPSAWTEHTTTDPVTLMAEVNPKVGDQRPIPECAGCETNNVYALAPLAFTATGAVVVSPFQLQYTFPIHNGHGRGIRMVAPDLRSLYDRAQNLLPLAPNGLRFGPYPGPVIDVTQDVRQVYLAGVHASPPFVFTQPNFSQCIFSPGCRSWIQALEIFRIKQALPQPSTPNTPYIGFTPMPDGFTLRDRALTVTGADTPPRSLTNQAHELLHLFGIRHASTCGGGAANGQTSDPWPPDDKGFIHGIGLDRRPNSGGPGLFRIIADGVGNPVWYDLMSYCANTNDSDAWISTDNWERFIRLDPPPGAVAAGATPAAATGGASNLEVGAWIGSGGRTQLIGAYATSTSPTGSVASSYHLRVLNRTNHVIRDVGVAPQPVADSPLQMLFVAVPARGAQAVELVHGGHVVARMRRPNPPPRVRLIAPRRGAVHARRGTIRVAWRQHGAKGHPLRALVQYLARGRRVWQTLSAGISGQAATVPVSLFAGARRARIRVVVNDGFSDATAVSAPLGIPPR